jgi:hypothetical protein
MKYFLLTFIIIVSLSCSSDDNKMPQVNQEYLDQLLGFYELKSAYTNDPIDLNGDGISGTDIFEEVEYCNMSKLLESYWLTVVDRGSYQKINFDVSISDWSNIEQNFTHCLRHQRLSSDIIINSMAEEVLLDTQDYQFDFMQNEHRTKILDFHWENRVVYLTLQQEFYMPDGEWETVVMNLEYEWVRSET